MRSWRRIGLLGKMLEISMGDKNSDAAECEDGSFFGMKYCNKEV